jgi:hypothetical protein
MFPALRCSKDVGATPEPFCPKLIGGTQHICIDEKSCKSCMGCHGCKRFSLFGLQAAKCYWGVLSALGGYLHGWAWYPWCGPDSHTHMCPWVRMVMCFGRMLPMRHLPVATCQRGKRPRQTSCPSEGATPEPFLPKVDGRHPTHVYWWKIMQILQGVLLSIDQIAR